MISAPATRLGCTPRPLFTRGDVRDRPKLWTLLQKVDCVFHLAARVSVQESVLYPREYNDVNVGGTVSLVEAIRDVGVRRVVLGLLGHGLRAAAEPARCASRCWPHPQVPYAVSKLAAEYYIFALGELNGIETVALRIFNAYGPGPAHPAGACAGRAALREERPERRLHRGVHGDGSQTRDFVYIDDVVDALVAAATAPDVNRAIINIGSGEETSINTLIADIGQVGGAPTGGHLQSAGGGRHHPTGGRPQAARRLLGYKPQVPLAQGLQRLLEVGPASRPRTGSGTAAPADSRVRSLKRKREGRTVRPALSFQLRAGSITSA